MHRRRKKKTCNSGILSINSSVLWKLLPQIKDKNTKRNITSLIWSSWRQKPGIRWDL